MKSRGVSQLFAIAAVMLLAVGCIDPIDTGDDIGLHVSEVEAPEAVPASGPITVTLTVAVGGCRRFDHISASKTQSTLILAARGVEVEGSCPDILIHETHSYEAQGPFTDPLTIIVYRPTTDPLVKTVRVD